MKAFTLIGGVDGVGRTSLTGVLSAESSELGVIIDTDKLNLRYGGDRMKGGKEAISLINSCLEKGINFTQETTLSGVRTLKTVKRARELGYCIKLYYIGVSSCGESLERIANRVRKGGHDIPSEDVERRFEKRFDDLERILPFCNEVKFFDNENGFAEVAEYKNGEIIPRCSVMPNWLTEYINWRQKK